jgi:hypothetical protein
MRWFPCKSSGGEVGEPVARTPKLPTLVCSFCLFLPKRKVSPKSRCVLPDVFACLSSCSSSGVARPCAPPPPSPRSGHSATLVGRTHLVIFGGLHTKHFIGDTVVLAWAHTRPLLSST